MRKKQYRPWSHDEQLLFPPSLKDWVEDDHPVYRVLEVVGELDLSEIEDELQEKDARGTRPYDPEMMLSLLIYAYSRGIYSSRRIARAVQDQVPFRVLTANQMPHFTVINRFRDRHREAIPGLFAQVVLLCRELGLVDLRHVSFDGTKMKANASKHKAMSYKRMAAEIEKLEEEIRKLLEESAAIDAAEDEAYGEGRDLDELPAELKRRQDRLAKIREAKSALEEEARKSRAARLREQAAVQRQKAEVEEDETEAKRKRTRSERAEKKADSLDPPAEESPEEAEEPTDIEAQLPTHRVQTTTDGLPTAKAQRNFTDPDSRIMPRDKTYLQGYNAQIAVDSKSQVIVAADVSNEAPDQGYLRPMLDRVRATTGADPSLITADAGYMSGVNVEHCSQRGIDPYIAPGREKALADDAGRQVEPAEWQAMRAKLTSSPGDEIYRRRKTLTEPVFGQIRGARRFGSFSMRGLEKVKAEWLLIAMVHDILKVIGARDSTTAEATP